MGCVTISTSGSGAADGSSDGSIKSVVPSAFESVMLEGLPRAETAKSSSNSSP